MTVFFCETEHHYVPYDDWFKLARLSGYQVIPIADMDVLNPDHVYIVNHFGALGMPGNEHEAKARIILWQLEWTKVEEKIHFPSNIREIWASDKWFADYYGARYVLLGSHKKLADTPPNPNGDKAYDLALMMYRNPYRRARVISALKEAGVTIAPDGWGSERHTSLLSSRAMLHIHQEEDVRTVAPLRFAIAAAYQLPLITETCTDFYGLDSCVPVFPYHNLADGVKTLLTDTSILDHWGAKLYQLMCRNFTFWHSVESML